MLGRAMFEDLPLDELRALLGEDFSAGNVLVEVARCPPVPEPSPELFDDFLRHHQVKVGWSPKPLFNPKALRLIDRSTAARYIAVIAERDLVFHERRLPRATAEGVASSFLAPFGPRSWFYPNISLDEKLLVEKEENRPSGYGVYTHIFGNTLEEGVFAIDPDGHIGAFFVGEED
jgi:hypothetical protein